MENWWRDDLIGWRRFADRRGGGGSGDGAHRRLVGGPGGGGAAAAAGAGGGTAGVTTAGVGAGAGAAAGGGALVGAAAGIAAGIAAGVAAVVAAAARLGNSGGDGGRDGSVATTRPVTPPLTGTLSTTPATLSMSAQRGPPHPMSAGVEPLPSPYEGPTLQHTSPSTPELIAAPMFLPIGDVLEKNKGESSDDNHTDISVTVNQFTVNIHPPSPLPPALPPSPSPSPVGFINACFWYFLPRGWFNPDAPNPNDGNVRLVYL
mmetsp:Transcript_5630/g.8708  ORF Transcript_5630/g.8708 Transcript_5630/m.8708 type:complete len:261 (-) Transcript_5630:768-1550(-)